MQEKNNRHNVTVKYLILLDFFAEVENLYRQVLFITADCEVEGYVGSLAEIRKHLEELRKLFVLSADNLKCSVNKNIRNIVVTCADTCKETVKCLVTIDSVCICF